MFISIASIAALVCAAVVFYLMAQINRTRLVLQADGVAEFNFIQQNDHNFDAFVHALNAWRLERVENPYAVRGFIRRFDVIWSAFGVDEAHWLGSLARDPRAIEIIADSRAFLSRNEPLMLPEAPLSDAAAARVADEAHVLSERVYALGLELFQKKSALRDDVARRMDRLTRALWFFGGSLALAGCTLFALLTRAYRRASALVIESSNTQAQLATALEELTDGDIERRRQNRFIATASHDLRQPLHALGLNLVTLRGHVDSRLGQRILENASRSTETLNQLLGSVLDVSRLDAEVIEVKRSDILIDEVFEQLHHTYLPEAIDRGLAFDVHLPDLVVHVDRVLLGRILGNLVSNALRYTESGGVTLSAEPGDGRVIIAIADTGPGIPEREREAVFDEYYQMDTPGGPRSQGLGLGLSIVHRLARLLDIGLEVRSTVGIGTRFELAVPAGDLSRVVHRSIDDDRRVADGVTFDGVHFDGLKVLVIDDDRDVRDGMHLLLEQRSCDVIAAESTEEALAAIVAEEIVPDVVVADYRLRGDRTGADAIRAVRDEVNEDVPALIVTGDTSPDRLREATASGFRLLNKPVEPEELFDAIGELAGRRVS